MSSLRLLRYAALTSWLAACAGSKADGDPAFVDLADDDSASAPSNDGNARNTGNGSGSQVSGSPLTGLPTEAAPSEAGAGCQKVDFLFVVDNSLSMLEEQTALVHSFPGFMNVVEQTLGASDFHVMVVDTDAGDVRDTISSLLGQGSDACGPTMGAGRRQSQSGADCGLASGRRYLDSSQADLSTAFSCVAEVGTLGNPREAPVDSLLASIGPSLQGTGGCNAGFLRSDAILVVTLIGDEDDSVSVGEPALWRQAIVQAKGGSDDSIVFLGLIGGQPSSGVSSCGATDSAPEPRLHSLIESFSLGTVGDICAADYAPFFAQAVSVIDTACQDFEPVIR
jgi:hypothetical protein